MTCFSSSIFAAYSLADDFLALFLGSGAIFGSTFAGDFCFLTDLTAGVLTVEIACYCLAGETAFEALFD